MKYPLHWINRAESRGYRVEDMKTKQFKCEWQNCTKPASSIHHVKCSYRTNRDNSPENLISLCLNCHEWIHNHNNFDNRQILLDRVKFILG